jgi:5'-nucleotidase
MRIENPKGNRIQQIFIGDESLIKEKIYDTAFVTIQGVPATVENSSFLTIFTLFHN